ncbi:hypothetical protein PPL_04994 [Heterostelium album PN500]|uniref:Uncharacterized protein n=1 Tax=Heterostelium pallidum (strain ATCC 26659 / Pp 5 / PN500) TaxID=670386 RepID=D3B950_HETP5|nr:hypothetical protein PPL_04994 [Heterostelium album PN500]EFA82089.1 hypothetical protein PPL_04994 [Heterostelium album PN500]|eukprot:XP_020434206.1 hypothetical protein PPL_04994 [Heterostelium album PN500]
MANVENNLSILFPLKNSTSSRVIYYDSITYSEKKDAGTSLCFVNIKYIFNITSAEMLIYLTFVRHLLQFTL